MDNHPKKSKALVITLVAIVLLSGFVYLVFKKGDKIFGTKNSTTISKLFSPLLGSSQKKNLNAINSDDPNGLNTTLNGGTTGTTTTNPADSNSNSNGEGLGGEVGIGSTTGIGGGTLGSNGGLSSTGGFGQSGGVNAPPLIPLPTPTTTGSTPASDTSTPNTTDVPSGNENPTPTSNPTTAIESQSLCPDDPLVFTEAEKVQLADLLRQYYLIASTLKTADDIVVAENDALQNNALITQITELTDECVAQKNSPTYTGPQTIKNNPFFADPSNTLQSYITGISTWIHDSEYLQPNYGAPTITTGTFGIPNGINWPDAYYGPKIHNYAEFESKFNIW